MCYVVPVLGVVATTRLWNRTKNIKIGWLNTLFWGGSLFGIIDHLWNKELFLISKDWASDLMLGVVISFGILLFWVAMLALAKMKPGLNNYLSIPAQS